MSFSTEQSGLLELALGAHTGSNALLIYRKIATDYH